MKQQSSHYKDIFRKAYIQKRIHHWNKVACQLDTGRNLGGYYHDRLKLVYKHIVGSNKKILEIGCGTGNLLAALNPSRGVGIDFSAKMLEWAKDNYPHLHLVVMDAHDLDLEEKFDYIILSDLINDLYDVQEVFRKVYQHSAPRTRVLINTYSRLWEYPLRAAEKLGLAKPNLNQNWLTPEDVKNLLILEDFEIIRNWQEIIWPLRTPFIDSLLNRFLVKITPFHHLALTHFLLARPKPIEQCQKSNPTVSIIIPTRNEAGNIPQILRRTPRLGRETEIIFVEGNSIDRTYEVIEEEIRSSRDFECKLFKQKGVGKGDAVRLGFSKASGDILMILDADLTVPPEALIEFFGAIVSRKGELINGVRLVYPIENQAMQFFNLVGNKFFSLAFSWLLGQPIKDTLCGTKVLWREDYLRIEENRIYFGDFDPFGDFDLLFGASKLGLKIVDLPIRYRARTYGSTNIQRWKHGLILLKMLMFAAGRLKFI